MRNFTIWVSQRLRLNGSGRQANATGVIIAVTGVALALIIMEFTIAIVLGFKHQITDRIMGFDGEIWVLPEYDYELGTSVPTVSPDSALISIISQAMPEAGISVKFSQPGIIKTANDFAGIYFTGFGDTHDYTFERSNIVKGAFPDFADPDNSAMAVISQSVANTLGIDTGDKIDAYFFINDAIKARRFEVAALYESGFGDFDRTIAYVPITTLRRVAAADSAAGTQVSVTPLSTHDIETQAAALQNALIDAYQSGETDKLYPVDNVMHTGAMYFNWLELLNTNVVVIFLLMICVSGFTLVSSMFIIILERIPTIGILRALGATRLQIRSIFINMTLKIVGIGIVIGNILGIGLLYVQKTFNVLALDPEMYYLKYVPVEMNLLYFLYLNIGVVLVSWLVLILPSRLASNISPAVTMRFE